MAFFERRKRRPEEGTERGTMWGTDFSTAPSAPVEMTGRWTDFSTRPSALVEMTGAGMYGGMPKLGGMGQMAAEQAAVLQPIGKEEIRKAMMTLRKYKAGKANFERRIIENEQWWKLRHWEHMKERGTTPLRTKSAWLVNVILSKHADAMDATPEPNCLPRAEDDQQEAEILSKVVPVILQQNDFEKTWSDNWWKKLKAGVAFYGVFWDQELHNGLGDVTVRRIDPLALYWEPGITNLQDSRNIFLVQLQDNDALEEQYPQLKDKLKSKAFVKSEYLYDDTVDTSEKSPVIDWYYKKRNSRGKTVLHYVKFVGETVLYATENEAGSAGGMGAPGTEFSAPVEKTGRTDFSASAAPPVEMTRMGRRAVDNRPYGGADGIATAPVGLRNDATEGFAGVTPGGEGAAPFAAPGAESLSERGLYDHGKYPFFADVLFPEEGTPTGFGYIDICKDPQRQIDLMNNAIVANCVAAATPRWLKRGDDGINEAEYADWTRPFVHVQGSIDENAMRQITVTPLSGNYLSILESKIAEMKETSGNRDVNNGGAPSGVTAASAIAAMQEQSGKLSRDQIQNSYGCYRAIVYCVIELFRQFYDLPRQFRIVGADGMQDFVKFDNQGLLIRQQPDGKFRLPEFDIEVTAQRQSAYTKLSQNELALQFYQLGFFNPQAADPALAALDMMDFRGKEQVRKRVQQNGGLMQMLQQAMMEIQMLRAKLGIPMPGAGGENTNDDPSTAARSPSPASRGGLQETDATGKERQRNAITEKARAQANAATQPR